VQFEVYADEALTQLVASSQIDKAPLAPGNGAEPVLQPTAWTVPMALKDNTHYWWRARAFDGTVYSLWANARLFVNLFNDPPSSFNLINPEPDTEVSSLMPTLSWNNSIDKDGDAISYVVTIFRDAGLTDKVVESTIIPENISGSTSWTDTAELSNHTTYYWNVVANDSLGAQTTSFARIFVVNTGNVAPTDPVILSPVIGSQSVDVNAEFTIQNSTDTDGDHITYLFEIDTVNTFDSLAKESSSNVLAGTTGTTSWFTGRLTENQHYWWRVKAQDGRADSAWVVGNFLMNAVNDPPSIPTIKNPGSGSWSAVLQPILEANAVVDPEGGAVRYQFEIYQSADLKQKITEGISSNTALIVPIPLIDKTTYWWRVRALDAQDNASDWSPAAVLYVSTGLYQAPSIALTAPATPITPDLLKTPTGIRKQVTIHWEGIDPNIEPTVALYRDIKQSGFEGALIAGGLIQHADAQTGSYVWNVTSLPSGTYYLYATITDAGGVGRAYAPGAVVIPNQPQTGKIVITANTHRRTSENGKAVKFNVRLRTAPTANVTIPLSSNNVREGIVAPTSLIFTPQNWSVNQSVTATGKNDCVPDGNKAFQALSGKAVTTDPNYIGLSGSPVNLINNDDNDLAGTTNNPNLHICGKVIVTERRLDTKLWEYTLTAQLTNTGASLSGVTARVVKLPAVMELIEDTLIFGASHQGDTITSENTMTIRSHNRVSAEVFKQGFGFKWKVMLFP
jgi:hypothetical protein